MTDSIDFEWTGEIADIDDVLDRVRSTGTYTVTISGERKAFNVATGDDYETVLRAHGLLAQDEQLSRRPDLLAPVQAHWHASGHSGCHFAAALSDRRREIGWRTWVIAPLPTASAYAACINEHLAPLLQDVEVDVVSFLLPGVTEPSDFAEVVTELAKRPGWRLRDEGSEDDVELGRVCRFGLDVEVGEPGNLHFSEILGFGAAAPMAYTRRAPCAELAIRAKAPARRRSDQRAFMAQIPLDLEQSEMAKWWE